MPESLPVHLNHDQLHDVQTVASFETTKSFPILLQNGDAPVHVHLHLDDELSQVASMAANNHFVDANATSQVGVRVEEGPRPIEGKLKIVTGHGAETDYVDVSIVDPKERADAVDVDAALADPVQRDTEDDDPVTVEKITSSLAGNSALVALGLFAVVVALTSAALSNSGAVLVGALVVLGSVAVAGYLLVGDS